MSTIHTRVRASLVALLLTAIASIGVVGCSEQNPTAPSGASAKRTAPSNYNLQRGKSVHLLSD